MRRCEHYTLDCEQEKMGCEGCAYFKKSADSVGMNESKAINKRVEELEWK